MGEWFHAVLCHRDRDPVGVGEAGRLRVLRRVVRAAGGWLLGWCVVDDHLHLLLACDARRAGIIARSVSQALDVPLAPAWIKPVRGRRYRRWAIDYLLLQPRKHGLPCHPALWSGSCFVDLVGARWLPGFRPSLLMQGLPRLRLRELFLLLDLGPEPLAPAADQRLFERGPTGLIGACFAALGAAPIERSKQPLQVEARVLACASAREVGLRLPDVAAALGVHASTARRLADRAVRPQARSALRRRIALEDRVAAATLAIAGRARDSRGRSA